MAYSHAPALTALKTLPQKAEEWHDLLQPFRDRYPDAPRVVQATHPREMLYALHDLAYDFLRGDLRPGEKSAQIENYDACVEAYQTLEETVNESIAAA